MAAWQFDVQFFRDARGAPLPATVPDAATQKLPLRFGAGEEMLDSWYVFGSEVCNRVGLLELDGEGCEIHARFDARSSETDSFVDAVCVVIEAFSCEMFSPELEQVIEPKSNALKRSLAWQYALDPTGYLGGLNDAR